MLWGHCLLHGLKRAWPQAGIEKACRARSVNKQDLRLSGKLPSPFFAITGPAAQGKT
jgi:hypothetical protein